MNWSLQWGILETFFTSSSWRANLPPLLILWATQLSVQGILKTVCWNSVCFILLNISKISETNWKTSFQFRFSDLLFSIFLENNKMHRIHFLADLRGQFVRIPGSGGAGSNILIHIIPKTKIIYIIYVPGAKNGDFWPSRARAPEKVQNRILCPWGIWIFLILGGKKFTFRPMA